MAVITVNRTERAKQFMPFDALKGLQEELRIREERRTRVKKIELSEERMDEISSILTKVDRYARVSVQFYSNGHYLKIESEVSEINSIYRFIRLGESKIYFDDIYSIEIIES